MNSVEEGGLHFANKPIIQATLPNLKDVKDGTIVGIKYGTEYKFYMVTNGAYKLIGVGSAELEIDYVSDYFSGYISWYSNTPTAIVLTTAGTYYPMTGCAIVYSKYCIATTSTVTVEKDGLYNISVNTSFSGSAAGIVVHGALFKNSVLVPFLEWQRSITATSVGSATTGGIMSLVEGDVLEFKFSSDTNSRTVTIEHFILTAIRIPD